MASRSAGNALSLFSRRMLRPPLRSGHTTAAGPMRSVQSSARWSLPEDPRLLRQKYSEKPRDGLRRAIEAWRRAWTPGPLSKQQLEQFFDEGFVLVHQVVPQETLQRAIRDLEAQVDEIAEELLAAGLIRDACRDTPFGKRLAQLQKQFPGAAVLMHKRGVLPRGVREVWCHPNLMGIAKQVLGPELAAHPVWNVRPKTPRHEQTTVPWHQDTAYLSPECWTTLMLTAWVPLVDATTRNGCMQVVRGGHRTGITAEHVCCAGDTWYVDLPETEMERTLGVNMARDVVTCEVPKGSALFLNSLLPHRSTDNTSDSIRWSLDMRWQRPNEPNGFYGLKDSLMLTSASDPSFKPAWDQWGRVDRGRLQEGRADKQQKAQHDFDTTISGPWMRTWNVVHRNRHTDAFEKSGIVSASGWG